MASQAEQLSDLIGFFNTGNNKQSANSYQKKAKPNKVVNKQYSNGNTSKPNISNRNESVKLNMFTDEKPDSDFTSY